MMMMMKMNINMMMMMMMMMMMTEYGSLGGDIVMTLSFSQSDCYFKIYFMYVSTL